MVDSMTKPATIPAHAAGCQHCDGGETPHAAPTLIEQLQSVPTFSVEQAAKALGISKAYAYLLVQRGELPVIRLGGKRVRVPTSALRRMMGVEDAA